MSAWFASSRLSQPRADANRALGLGRRLGGRRFHPSTLWRYARYKAMQQNEVLAWCVLGVTELTNGSEPQHFLAPECPLFIPRGPPKKPGSAYVTAVLRLSCDYRVQSTVYIWASVSQIWMAHTNGPSDLANTATPFSARRHRSLFSTAISTQFTLYNEHAWNSSAILAALLEWHRECGLVYGTLAGLLAGRLALPGDMRLFAFPRTG